METNATIIHPVTSFIKLFWHVRDKKLESKVISLEETKNILSKIEKGKLHISYYGDVLNMNPKETLNFIERNFTKTKDMKSITKYEVFETKKGKIHYMWLYQNAVNLQNENEIIFADYTPKRATLGFVTK